MKIRFMGLLLGIFLITSTFASFIPMGLNNIASLGIPEQFFSRPRGDMSMVLLGDDLDPLVDVVITVKINEIRSLVKSDLCIFPSTLTMETISFI